MPLDIKVLLIEDDQFLSDLYKMQLEKEGFRVVQSFDGLDGLAKIGNESPSIVLLDLILPELSGLEVLKKAKSNSTTSKVPIVILSNLRDEEKIKEALSLGAEGYMIKPTLTPKQVVAELRKYLKG